MRMLLSLSLLLIFAILSSYLAKQRGRDPIAWFMIGLFLGIFGPILLLLLPALTNENGEPLADLEENEDVKLANIHENHSGLHFSNKEWFYVDRKQEGPVQFEYLQRIWREGRISKNSFVWSEGMPKWQKIQEIPDFENALSLAESVPY